MIGAVDDFDVPQGLPFPPMEAELVRELPEGDGWQYEPKWDGFRGVLENLDGELRLWSRNGRPLLRYFPELQRLGDLLPPRSALDGEIVISRDGVIDFDAMQTRLHPAESRIRKLSAEIPAEFIVFDQLLWEGEAVWELPLEQRRARVEALKVFVVSPATRSADDARAWLAQFEALGLDGVVAKRLAATYLPGSRDAVVKVKEHRTADCVVLGIRWKADHSQIATLLLGLYREDGGLDYVGSCAVAAGKRQEVADRVLPLLVEDESEGRISEPNRWGTGELQEARVKPELVVEVRYDKVQGHRFRHGTKLIRWREDKRPADCTWREVTPPRAAGAGVESLFGKTQS
jgi:ATP-dependent DNA ligase